jgi:hypothetical protein
LDDKPAGHRGRVMLIDARQQFEKEPKSFGNKRNRITDVTAQKPGASAPVQRCATSRAG